MYVGETSLPMATLNNIVKSKTIGNSITVFSGPGGDAKVCNDTDPSPSVIDTVIVLIGIAVRYGRWA